MDDNKIFEVSLIETRLHWKKSRRYLAGRLETPEDAASIGRKILPKYLDRECVYVIACTAKMDPIGIQLASIGSMSSAILDPARILTFLLLIGAHSFVVFHNHVSGDTTPSKEDINVTKRMNEAAKLVGLYMADHLILGNGFTSMKEKGLL